MQCNPCRIHEGVLECEALLQLKEKLIPPQWKKTKEVIVGISCQRSTMFE